MDKFLSKLGVKRDESRRSGSTSPRLPAASAAPTPAPAPPPSARPPRPPESEFAKSARAAASAGMQYEREINEHTDLGSLTDQEISRLMEGMDGDVLKQALVTGPVPLLAVKKEYLNGSKVVLQKLEWLENHGWDQVWRARGDGDCFYRSFTLAYLFRVLYSPTPSSDAALALSSIHNTVPSMERAGFQRDLLDEFLAPLLDAIASFIDPEPGHEPTEYGLLQILQDPEKSNSIVVALRLMTGAHIRTNPDNFEPFLFSPSTLEPISPEKFCREEVEPCGKEADHAQIMALAAALQVPVRVAYLDRSDVGGGEVINWVEFGTGAAEDLRPLTLLYRPGHFDVVTKDHMQEELRRQQVPQLANPAKQQAEHVVQQGTQPTTTSSASQPSTSQPPAVLVQATTAATEVPATPSTAGPTPVPEQSATESPSKETNVEKLEAAHETAGQASETTLPSPTQSGHPAAPEATEPRSPQAA